MNELKQAERAARKLEREIKKAEKLEQKRLKQVERDLKKAEAVKVKIAKAEERQEKKNVKILEKDEKWQETLANIYVADFETTTKANYLVEGCVRVFIWGFMNVHGDYYRSGTDIYSFINEVEKHKGSTIIFHNLAFDGTFIESHLLEMGYEFRTFNQKMKLLQQIDDLKAQEGEIWEAVMNNGVSLSSLRDELHLVKEQIKQIQLRLRFLDPNQFTTIRDKTNNVFSIDVNFNFGNTVKFIDSLKWFPGTSIEKLGKMVKVKKLKEDFEYKAYRAEHYNPTSKEWSYMKHDVLILQKAALEHLQTEKRVRLTRTSYAFNKMVDSYNEGKGEGEKFKDIFPATDVQTWKKLKPFYNGGLTLVMPGQDNIKHIGKGYTLDFNSLYPYVMCRHLLPFGEAIEFEGEYKNAHLLHDKYNLYVVEIKAKFTLKEGMIPSLAKSFTYSSKSVLSDKDIECGTMALTSVDLAHFFRNYDVTEYEEIRGMAWQSVEAPFAEYINHEMKNKVAASQIDPTTGEMVNELGRFFSKLNMNGCYGYLGKSIENFAKDSELDENGVLVFTSYEEEEEAQQYLPAAVFITAWARHELLTAGYEIIAADGLTLLYMDTDSLHFLGDYIPDTLDIHDDKLGALSIDGQWHEAKFMRAKLYVEALTDKNWNPLYVYEMTDEEDENGKKIPKYDQNGNKIIAQYQGQNKLLLDVKGAGLTSKAKAMINTIDEMEYGIKFPDNQKKIVKGGTLLVDGWKELKDHRKPLEEFADVMTEMELAMSF